MVATLQGTVVGVRIVVVLVAFSTLLVECNNMTGRFEDLLLPASDVAIASFNQSSVAPFGGPPVAERLAGNGDFRSDPWSGDYCMHTDTDVHPWWTVAFRDHQPAVHSLMLTHRSSSCCGSRFQEIVASVDGVACDRTVKFGSGPPYPVQVLLTCPQPLAGTEVKLRQATTAIVVMTLCEVEIFASKGTLYQVAVEQPPATPGSGIKMFNKQREVYGDKWDVTYPARISADLDCGGEVACALRCSMDNACAAVVWFEDQLCSAAGGAHCCACQFRYLFT